MPVVTDAIVARSGGQNPLILPSLTPVPVAEKGIDEFGAPERKAEKSLLERKPRRPLTRDVRAAIWIARRIKYAAAVISWVGDWIIYQAPRLHSFLAAHAFGWVLNRSVRAHRKAQCMACPHRKVHENGFEECLKEHCGCGTHRAANLNYKRSLAGYVCKDGRFDYHSAAKRYYSLSKSKE